MKGCPKCGQRFGMEAEFCPEDGETLVVLNEHPRDALIGTTLEGRYAIQQLLGEGGMGVVYLATHAIIGKKCAVKVLRQEIANEAEVSERFIQEARSAAAIGDEHVIEITDFGQTPGGSPYFVMEYLDGRSLHDVLLESSKLEVDRSLHIIDQCCQALAKAHDVGVIHRDLKPENLFLIERGSDPDYVKVLDFGIAKVARETGRLTRTGTIFGTPQYMSPEQAAGTSMDERTDIYSLGIIMYEMLCGKVPFEADTFMGVLTKHLYEEPIPPSRRSPPVKLPEAVESVLLKAIAKKRDRRYRTMTAFQEDIQAVLGGKTPRSLYDKIRESTVPPPPSQVVGDSGNPARPRSLPEKRRGAGKAPLVIGAAITAAVAVVGAFLLLGGLPKEARTDPNAKAVVKLPPPASVEEETPEAPPKAEVAPRTITISSIPTGGILYKNGEPLGVLPREVNRPVSDDPVMYEVKQPRHEAQEIRVTASTPDDLVVEMKPVAAPPEKLSSNIPDNEKHGDKPSKKKRKKKKTEGLTGDIVNPWD